MNVDESLQVLLVTLQVLGRPTLLAYVERSAAVTHALESGLRSLRRHRCRQLRVGSKTSIYALDAWGGITDPTTVPLAIAQALGATRWRVCPRGPRDPRGAACVPGQNSNQKRRTV